MRRFIAADSGSDAAVVAALQAMNAEDLRSFVRRLLAELEDGARARVLDRLLETAARHEPAVVVDRPSPDDVRDSVAFAESAAHAGYADPEDYDQHLRRGIRAFLARDYAAAASILGALLTPLSSCDVSLGEHETVDEMLDVDISECVLRQGVAVYMTTPAAKRAEAVAEVLEQMGILGPTFQPLTDLERAAVEPHPDLNRFLRDWRKAVERRCTSQGPSDSDTTLDMWRREIIERLDGVDGLARLARATGRPLDLQAWCDALVNVGDWPAALDAFTEAAAAPKGTSHHRGRFLDGAALAAERLNRVDLPDRLELAWRQAPSLPRLLRWLGSSDAADTVVQRAAAARVSCPEEAHRQRAFLCAVVGDLPAAASLLATAPALGWSDREHPGHLLVQLISDLLDRDAGGRRATGPWRVDRWAASLDNGLLFGEPSLPVPALGSILETAGVGGPLDDRLRATLLQALRTAAERRLAGLAGKTRRRHYAHGAELVAACMEHDPSPGSATWLATIRERYRRYPALRAELDRALRPLTGA